MRDRADAGRLDAVQTGNRAGWNVQAATRAPRLRHDIRIFDQRADADHHQILARSESLARQLRDDVTARCFDDQIRRPHEFIQRQIRWRTLEWGEKLPRTFLGPAGDTCDAHRQLAVLDGFYKRLANRTAADNTNGFNRHLLSVALRKKCNCWNLSSLKLIDLSMNRTTEGTDEIWIDGVGNKWSETFNGLSFQAQFAQNSPYSKTS